jgi:hypothetical protein
LIGVERTDFVSVRVQDIERATRLCGETPESRNARALMLRRRHAQ